jgi:hypothetical protein
MTDKLELVEQGEFEKLELKLGPRLEFELGKLALGLGGNETKGLELRLGIGLELDKLEVGDTL